MRQHKNNRNNFRKVLASWILASSMLISMSAVSYAQFPLGMGLTIAQTTPISMQNNAYRLDLQKAVVKHTLQTSRMISAMPGLTAPDRFHLDSGKEQLAFYPGDTLYIPLVNVSSGSIYSERTRPANWEFSTSGVDKNSVSNIRWANENGRLSIAVDFAPELMQSKPMEISLSITLHDNQNQVYNQKVELSALFRNVTREVMPGTINEIVSPMNLKTGEVYHGEPLTLSFGHSVFLKDVVLPQNTTMYLNLDRSFDHEIANQYRSFDIQCYNFTGNEDVLEQPAKICLPAQKNETYVYEVVDGKLKRQVSDFDEENGLVCFMTQSLGYYVVSPILMK